MPWAVAGLLLIPIFLFVLLLIGVRTRRAATNLNLTGLALLLVGDAFLFWQRSGIRAAYHGGYGWLVSPVAVTGATQFQNFTVNLAIQLDHVALLLILCLHLLVAGALIWHRQGGRQDGGPVRFQVAAVLLVFAVTGVLVATDLVEILAFWLTAGVASYLLLSHRWGTEAAARAARYSFAPPLAADLCLLLGVAVLYSRYGNLEVGALPAMLHTTYGAGLKSLTAGTVLMLLALVVRTAGWPFNFWQSGPLDAPSASLAMVGGVWPLMAASVLQKVLPLIDGSGPQAREVGLALFGLAALASPLAAFTATSARQAFSLAGAGIAAASMFGLLGYAPASLTMAALAVAALGRSGGQLALGDVVRGFRSDLLGELGGGWRRMPRATAALALAALALLLALPLSVLEARAGAVLYIALPLSAISLFGVFGMVAQGPARRRRTFDPTRVRDAASALAAASATLGAAGVVIALWQMLPGGRDFLSAGAAGSLFELVWAVGVVVLAVLSAFAVSRLRGSLGRVMAPAAAGQEVSRALLSAHWARFVGQPLAAIGRSLETNLLGRLESALGRAVQETAGLGELVLGRRREEPRSPARGRRR